MAEAASVIEEEVRRFDAVGADWWNPSGPMAPLHRMNPIRLNWLRDTIAAHFRRTPANGGPLEGLTVVDIGCGAGLISEPLSRMGADVTGLDPAPTSIAIARAHAEETGAQVFYLAGTVEDLAREGAAFDVVVALEVVEHVNDVPAFVAAAASLVRPGGMIALSTLNRTLKSFMLAVVGAEYVLRWLEPGTHHWEQFVTPQELRSALRAAGLVGIRPQGLVYNPLKRAWSLSRDCGVNYFMSAAKM
ncbi:MAG: bifunctional 2-polyprenyl-6-hydroxyphenol methylase/3-demethylubiquinol 3-O-methyltransferase UbiG [Roseiarcus sp.]